MNTPTNLLQYAERLLVACPERFALRLYGIAYDGHEAWRLIDSATNRSVTAHSSAYELFGFFGALAEEHGVQFDYEGFDSLANAVCAAFEKAQGRERE